jgi:hypothetical protein
MWAFDELKDLIELLESDYDDVETCELIMPRFVQAPSPPPRPEIYAAVRRRKRMESSV